MTRGDLVLIVAGLAGHDDEGGRRGCVRDDFRVGLLSEERVTEAGWHHALAGTDLHGFREPPDGRFGWSEIDQGGMDERGCRHPPDGTTGFRRRTVTTGNRCSAMDVRCAPVGTDVRHFQRPPALAECPQRLEWVESFGLGGTEVHGFRAPPMVSLYVEIGRHVLGSLGKEYFLGGVHDR